MAAAQILFVICSLASCSASVVEGAKWKVDPLTSRRRTVSSPRGKTDDKWEEVTYVLEKARENATFPGVFLCTVFIGSRGAGLVCAEHSIHGHYNSLTFPSLPFCSGCVAAVGDETGFLYSNSVGSFTYGGPDPVTHTNPPMTTTVRDS